MIALNNSNISSKIDNIGKLCDTGLYIHANVWENLAELGVVLVCTAEELPGYNCLGWAFERLGLSKYSGKFGFDVYKDLKTGAVEELESVQDIKENDLIAYYHSDREVSQYAHFGVCVNEFARIIESKWGYNGDLFRHRLDAIPSIYGDSIEIYRKK